MKFSREFCLVPLSATNERESEVTMPTTQNAIAVTNDFSNITSNSYITEFSLERTTTEVLKTAEQVSNKTEAKTDEKTAVNDAEKLDETTGKLQHNMCESIYNAESRGNFR